jgi:dTMP kinase
MKTGKLVTFEGGEGVGKTTQARLLSEKLSNIGLKVHVTREPGGDEVAEKIRDILKTSASLMDPFCETLLLFAARRDHYVKLIAPLLKDGYIVICDRFYDSSLVYQGVLKQVSFENIMVLKRMTVGDLEPDLTIVLDVDSNISTGRLAARKNLISDEYDLMKKEEHDIIRSGFQKIADVFSFRSILINADGPEEKISLRIMKEVEKIISKSEDAPNFD